MPDDHSKGLSSREPTPPEDRPISKATRLRQLIEFERPVLTAGAHDGLGAVLAERVGYDAVWASGFGISAARGLPDAGLLGLADYLHAATMMNSACNLPVIVDCDTGFGSSLSVAHAVRQFEAAGIAAVCFEDKVFPKVNSFAEVRQRLAPIPEFQHKISTAKATQRDSDLMVIARTEAFVAGKDLAEALTRAHAFAEAGADAILIHSKASTPDEVEQFLASWDGRTPVVVVPTTYYAWSADEAAKAGASMVIYANQSLRASVSAMTRALQEMLRSGSSADLEGEIATIGEIFELQDLDAWLQLEQ